VSIERKPVAAGPAANRNSEPEIPELLAPVGSFETFMAALDGGADAVYLGLKKFSARVRAENFTLADLELMTLYAHQRQVRIYVALNTLIRQDELAEIYSILNDLLRIGVDAVIVQDLGLVNIIRRDFPALAIHLSTQLAIHNAAGVAVMAARGCKRVVLGRELALDEIKQVARRSPLELELFVYGALCISVAGLCQFSSFFSGQSANRGRCSQPCRRPYRYAGEEGYFFSPADFNALEFLPELVASGITSCKIEGRMKGSQYVKVVVSVFRQALDEIKESGKLAPENLKTYKNELKEAYARPTTSANLAGGYPATIIEPKRAATIGVVVGKIRRVSKEGNPKKAKAGGSWRVVLRSSRPLSSGDRLKVVRQGKDGRDNSFTLKEGAFKLEKRRSGKGAGTIFSLELPFAVRVGDLLVKVGSRDSYGRRGSARIRRDLETAVAGLSEKNRAELSRIPYRHKQWLSLPESYTNERRNPPPAAIRGDKSQPAKWLLKLADFNTARPFLKRRGAGVALELNGRVKAAIFRHEADLVRRFPKLEWSLPPLNYPGREHLLGEVVKRLVGAGFRRFHLNGLDQLALFSSLDIPATEFRLATGPFLHAANQAALSFYAEDDFSALHLSS
jgi:putative protease